MQLSAKDLRRRVKAVLDAVESGQEVIITRRGRPRAKLTAFGAPAGAAPRPEWFGMWADRTDLQDPSAWVRQQRKSRFEA